MQNSVDSGHSALRIANVEYREASDRRSATSSVSTCPLYLLLQRSHHVCCV
jgi:hypothetical protein